MPVCVLLHHVVWPGHTCAATNHKGPPGSASAPPSCAACLLTHARCPAPVPPRDDFSTKKRERCVRLDIPYKFDPRRVPASGLDEFEACVKECIRASFEIRQAAYDEEVRLWGESSHAARCRFLHPVPREYVMRPHHHPLLLHRHQALTWTCSAWLPPPTHPPTHTHTPGPRHPPQVKKLLNDRLEPSWNFTTLYLVKDSFALMLECAGLYEDAFKEYLELETCYLETLARGALASMDFGEGAGVVVMVVCGLW